MRFLAVLLGALWSVAASAQLLIISGGGGAASEGGSGPPGVPDFEAVYGLEWTPVFPTEPTTSTTAFVDDATEFDAAKATSGTHIVMRTGSYGDITVTGSDLLITIQDGATIGTLSLAGDSGSIDDIRIENENCRSSSASIEEINGGPAFNRPVDDLILECLYVNSGTQTTAFSFTIHGRRVAVFSNYIRTPSYGIWSDQGSQGRARDMYFWNNQIVSGTVTLGEPNQFAQHAVRMTGCDRCALLDNNHAKEQDGQMLRVYARGDFTSAYNQWQAGPGDNPGSSIDGSTSGDSGTPFTGYATHGIHVRNDTFYNEDGPINTGAFVDSTGTSVYIGENTTYGGTLPTTGPAGYSFGTATNNSYTTPPAWVHYENR